MTSTKTKEEVLKYKICLISFFCLVAMHMSYALPAEIDSTNSGEQVHWQSFDQATIETLQKDPDLKYEEAHNAWKEWINDMLARLVIWIASFFQGAFNINVSGETVEWVLYSIGILIVGGAVFFLLKMNGVQLFYNNKKSGSSYVVSDENIHEIEFDSVINEFLRKQDYRLAIRHMYLYALKKLDDQGEIKWAPHKTEENYKMEIHTTSLRIAYEQLAYVFDFVWYGHFEANEKLAANMQLQLDKIDQRKEVRVES